MAKRCKYSDKETGACSCEKFYRDKDGISHCVMDPYTTENCNMKKRKPKLRRVKAWAWIRERDGKVWDACVVKWSTTQNLVPCTILIDEKYLRRNK